MSRALFKQTQELRYYALRIKEANLKGLFLFYIS